MNQEKFEQRLFRLLKIVVAVTTIGTATTLDISAPISFNLFRIIIQLVGIIFTVYGICRRKMWTRPFIFFTFIIGILSTFLIKEERTVEIFANVIGVFVFGFLAYFLLYYKNESRKFFGTTSWTGWKKYIVLIFSIYILAFALPTFIYFYERKSFTLNQYRSKLLKAGNPDPRGYAGCESVYKLKIAEKDALKSFCTCVAINQSQLKKEDQNSFVNFYADRRAIRTLCWEDVIGRSN